MMQRWPSALDQLAVRPLDGKLLLPFGGSYRRSGIPLRGTWSEPGHSPPRTTGSMLIGGRELFEDLGCQGSLAVGRSGFPTEHKLL